MKEGVVMPVRSCRCDPIDQSNCASSARFDYSGFTILCQDGGSTDTSPSCVGWASTGIPAVVQTRRSQSNGDLTSHDQRDDRDAATEGVSAAPECWRISDRPSLTLRCSTSRPADRCMCCTNHSKEIQDSAVEHDRRQESTSIKQRLRDAEDCVSRIATMKTKMCVVGSTTSLPMIGTAACRGASD